MLLAMFIPVEGSPGFVCLVGGIFYGVWCRFPRSHHPRKPQEGVRVKNTSLNVAEKAKKKGESLISSLSHMMQEYIYCIYIVCAEFASFFISAAYYHKIT